MSKKETEVAVLTEEQLEILNGNYPMSEEGDRLTLPRFGMLSKDIVEESGTGRNKKIEVIQPAGTFFTERDLGETNEEGKKVWTKEFIDSETVDVVIAFHRYQLRKFDSSLNKFISSPIYDTPDQVLPLYLDKQVIKRGTEKELQMLYPALTQKGKPTSDLKKETILYVLYNNEMFQMNLSVSSGWNFSTYKRSVNPSTVITTLGSVEDTFGSNVYRKVTFAKGRTITPDEFNTVVDTQAVLKEQVQKDSQQFLQLSAGSQEEIDADKVFENM